MGSRCERHYIKYPEFGWLFSQPARHTYCGLLRATLDARVGSPPPSGRLCVIAFSMSPLLTQSWSTMSRIVVVFGRPCRSLLWP